MAGYPTNASDLCNDQHLQLHAPEPVKKQGWEGGSHGF